MNWVYRFEERALKELKKLNRQAQQDILAYLDERVQVADSNCKQKAYSTFKLHDCLQSRISLLWHCGLR